MIHQNEKPISIRQAAEILDGSEQYVRMLIRSKELEGRKLGGKFYTTEEAIQRAVLGEDSSPPVIPPSPSKLTDVSASATALAEFE